MDAKDYFKKFLYEAPGEDPPDNTDDGGVDESPPPDMDMSEEGTDDTPPDIDDSMGSEDSGFDDMPDMDGSDDYGDMEDTDNGSTENNLELTDKISAILNQELYNRFIELVTEITSQISQIKNNSDVLYSVTPEVTNFLANLNKLEENIRLYLKNYFMAEKDYNKNLHFFNKCLNLQALLNKAFNVAVKKGIKNVDT